MAHHELGHDPADTVQAIVKMLKAQVISEAAVPKHLRGFTNWGINSSSSGSVEQQLKPLITTSAFKSDILPNLTGQDQREKMPPFLPDKKMALFNGSLLCAMDNVIFKCETGPSLVEEKVGKFEVVHVSNEHIHYIDVKENTVFIAHSTDKTIKISVLQQSPSQSSFTRIGRIKLPWGQERFGKVIYEKLFKRMCISFPIILFWKEGSSGLQIWNFFAKPNGTIEDLKSLEDIFTEPVDVVGIVDVKFQLLLVITTDSVTLLDLCDMSTEGIYQSDARDAGRIILYKFCVELDLLILLTDDGLLFSINIAKRNQILWQIGLPLLPAVDDIDSNRSEIVIQKQRGSSDLRVVVHWYREKVLQRLNKKGVLSATGKFQIVDQFDEEFIAVMVKDNDVSLPVRLPHLARTIELVKLKLHFSKEIVDQIFWFAKGSIAEFHGELVYLYGHLLFKLADIQTGECSAEVELVEYVEQYINAVHGDRYTPKSLPRTRQIKSVHLPVDDSWSFQFEHDFAINSETLGGGGTRRNLARALDLTFLKRIDSTLLSGKITQKEMSNGLYGKLRDEELAQKKVQEKRSRRQTLLLQMSSNPTLPLTDKTSDNMPDTLYYPKESNFTTGDLSSDNESISISQPKSIMDTTCDVTLDQSHAELGSQTIGDISMVAGHGLGSQFNELDNTLPLAKMPSLLKKKKKKRKSTLGFG